MTWPDDHINRLPADPEFVPPAPDVLAHRSYTCDVCGSSFELPADAPVSACVNISVTSRYGCGKTIELLP